MGPVNFVHPWKLKEQTWKESQACKHCLWTIFEQIVDFFGQTTILLQFWPINAHKYVLLSTINPPLLENIWYDGKYCNFGHFYMLRIYVNLQSFLSPKNWLAVKNQLFPCLWKSIKKISFMELVYLV